MPDLTIHPRPMQAEILQYEHGKMGVSAVPGSGKTLTLSLLASKLITGGFIDDDQEILVVTLANSAVNNFSSRIAGIIRNEGFTPGLGYRVRTLHGLAHDILRERPDLVGLPENFQILDERETEHILKSDAFTYLKFHPDFMTNYTDTEIALANDHKTRNQWSDLMTDIARSVIRTCKDEQLTPDELCQRIARLPDQPVVLKMVYEVYADYQRLLQNRSAIDFDDLIRLALKALREDSGYLASLQHRWPYILEDEAQDSSLLQETILSTIAGEEGNWVRVGDPNQAIYKTFTTASPDYLRKFLHQPGVQAKTLPNSGRSTASIISLANQLIRWSRSQHPEEALRNALSPPEICLTDAGDPQPNPPDNPKGIYFTKQRYSPEKEVAAIVRSLGDWLPAHPNETAAVLVPRNGRGEQIAVELRKAGIEPIELLRSNLSTRQTISLIADILRCLNEPANPVRLAQAFRALYNPEVRDFEIDHILKKQNDPNSSPEDLQTDEDDSNQQLRAQIGQSADLIQKCLHVEDFLSPGPSSNWLDDLIARGVESKSLELLISFRSLISGWQNATSLPIDQLILTISQELFIQSVDLAVAHKLATVLGATANRRPEMQLGDHILELDDISMNHRRIIGIGGEELGFDPDANRGRVVISTIHKAKGLEWDRVYLASVNNYDFPSGQIFDRYIGEKIFIRNKINLESEILAKLKALIKGDISGVYTSEGNATMDARVVYSEERLRLLFVAITRARRELVITWNTGKLDDCLPAIPLSAIMSYWEECQGDHSE